MKRENGYYVDNSPPPLPTDIDVPLRDFEPHYSDDRVTKGKYLTIFGTEREGLFYNHYDRILGDHKANCRAADKSGAKPLSVRWLQEYLAHFHGKPVQIEHVIVGVKPTGHCWQAIGYTY